MPSVLDRLKQRKLFQWALAYIATGWLILQVVDVVAEPWGVSDGIHRAVQAVVALGLPIALVLAWYHGEKGRQRVSGPEFVILTSLVVLAGVALTVFDPLGEIEPDGVETVEGPVDPNSIAVLPFLDMSAGGDQEYMSAGLAEEMRSFLQRIPELNVRGRTSSSAFTDQPEVTIPEIAAQLNVAHILEGSVRQAGGVLRITAQLIDARTDASLFSVTYDRELADIFAIQIDIARRVVTELKLTLLGELPTLQETDPEAYLLFIEAREIADNISEQNYARAMPIFERALEIDPEYAPAWIEMAAAYHDLGMNLGAIPRDEGLRLAREATMNALDADPDFAYAHAVLGAIEVSSNDPARAVPHFQRALEIDPDHPEVLMNTGMLLSIALGRHDEAIELLEHVRRRDPGYLVNLDNLAAYYLAAGRWEGAWEAARDAVDRGGPDDLRLLLLGTAMATAGNPDGAIDLASDYPDAAFAPGWTALAYHALGREVEAVAGLERFNEVVGLAFPSYAAIAYAQIGDVETAFSWLDRVTLESRLGWQLTHQALFEPLHDDPRWTAYRERMGQSAEVLDAIVFEVEVPR